MDAVVIAVAHNEFVGKTPEELSFLFKKEGKVLFDIKGILDKQAFEDAGYDYWRL